MRSILVLILVSMLTSCSSKNIAQSETSQVENRNVLNVALPGPAEFQPHSVENKSARRALNFVYEPLFHMSYEGEIVPVLAEELENLGKTVHITLKKSVKWHDGTELTAADAVYSINLVKDGLSVYKNDVIESVFAENDNRITVILKRAFDNPRCIFTFPIVKDESPTTMKTPIGTGPYMFFEKDGYDTYVFKRVNEKQGYSTLRMINLKNPLRQNELFQSGETDLIYINNEELTSYTPRVNAELYTYPTNHIIYIGFNNLKVPSEVRKSIFCCIDREKLTEKVFSHTAEKAAFPVLMGEFTGEAQLKAGGYEKRNGFFEKNGMPLEMEIILRPGRKHEELAEALIENLNSFGISCRLKNSSDFEKDLSNGSYHIVIDTAEIKTDFWELLEPGNPFFFQSRELDVMFETFFDNEEANNIFTNSLPFIPLAYRCDGISTAESAEEA